jgi:hypothetical protein
MSDYTTISVRQSDKEAFQEAARAVETELGESPSQSDVLREIAEAYVGRQPRGAWQNE